MIILDPQKPIAFTPTAYRGLPEAKRPVFFVLPPTARRFIQIMEFVSDDANGVFMFRGEGALKAVAAALVGWNENITDEAGVPRPFPGPEAAVEALDYRTLIEIGYFLLQASGVPDNLQGNSEPESPSPSGSSGTIAEGGGVRA